MREKITRNCRCAFRADESDGEHYIEGYFVSFEDVYDLGYGMTESIARNAFDKYLDGDIRIVGNHESTLVLGRTSAGTATVRADDHGIFVRCKINPEDTDAMNAYARTKRGDVSQASFGGYIISEERTEEAEGSHYTLTEVDVFEFSLCTFPAYEGTEVGAREKNNEIYNKRWKKRMEDKLTKWH